MKSHASGGAKDNNKSLFTEIRLTRPGWINTTKLANIFSVLHTCVFKLKGQSRENENVTILPTLILLSPTYVTLRQVPPSIKTLLLCSSYPRYVADVRTLRLELQNSSKIYASIDAENCVCKYSEEKHIGRGQRVSSAFIDRQ